MYKISKIIEKNIYNIDKPKFFIPANRTGKEVNIHTAILNLEGEQVYSNPFEFTNIWRRFVIIDDLFLSFVLYVAAVHLDHTHPNCKHTMLRDIIPSEILCTAFIQRLVDSLDNLKESFDFRCKRELIQFFTNLRDKYMFEYVSLNNKDSDVHMPVHLRFSEMFKIRKYKKYYEPTMEDDIYDMLNDETDQIFASLYDIMLRNIIVSCYKTYIEKRDVFASYLQKITSRKSSKELIDDKYINTILSNMYKDLGSSIEIALKSHRSIKSICYPTSFNSYLTSLNEDYLNYFNLDTKFCHAIRFLNEIDIDIISLLEVPRTLYNDFLTYFSTSYKYDMFPKDQEIYNNCKQNHVSIVIWNKNRLTLKENVIHNGHSNVHRNYYSMVFERSKKDILFTTHYSLRYDLMWLDANLPAINKVEDLHQVVNFKLSTAHRMYVFAGEFNEPMTSTSELWRVFDSYFQDPYTLFRSDLLGCKEEDFFYTYSKEKSAFWPEMENLGCSERRVSAVVHSNWQTRYLSTLKIPSFFNKFLFVSLQGKSHDTEVNVAKPEPTGNKSMFNFMGGK